MSDQAADILLVEDNRINQMVAEQILKRGGLSADLAASAEEALEALSAQPYKLVLLDLQLPEMSGIELAGLVRAGERGVTQTNVPIIALTAYDSEEDRKRCMAAGMNDFVVKPLEIDSFLQTVEANLRPTETEKGDRQAEAGPAEHADRDSHAWDPEELLVRASDDEELAQELLERFRNTVQEHASILRTAMLEGDIATARDNAHFLAGAAGNVAAHPLRDTFSAIEEAARAHDREKLEQLVEPLQSRIGAFHAAVDRDAGTRSGAETGDA
jgi:CheY-like chemotaxis protein